MDNYRDELRSLIEKEDVVSKVSRLIDLRIQYYSENNHVDTGTFVKEGQNSKHVIQLLGILRSGLDSSNALTVLELLLDDDFAEKTEEELRQAMLIIN